MFLTEDGWHAFELFLLLGDPSDSISGFGEGPVVGNGAHPLLQDVVEVVLSVVHDELI